MYAVVAGVEKESETGFLDYQKIWLSCFGDSLQKTTRMKQLHAKRVMAQRIVSLHPWHETLNPWHESVMRLRVLSNRDPLQHLLLLPHAKSISLPILVSYRC